jgi:hypothetical protein
MGLNIILSKYIYIKINNAQNNIKKVPKNKKNIKPFKKLQKAQLQKNNSNEISRYTFFKTISFNYNIF